MRAFRLRLWDLFCPDMSLGSVWDVFMRLRKEQIRMHQMDGFSVRVKHERLFTCSIIAISGCVYLLQKNVKSIRLQCGGSTRYSTTVTTYRWQPERGT